MSLESCKKRKFWSFQFQMEGSDIVNYGDTICVVGGFDDSTKTARKSVSCWNPLQIGADPDDEEEDSEEGGNKTTTKGNWKLKPTWRIFGFKCFQFLFS